MSYFSGETRRDPNANTSRPRCRPQLETLEDRCLLSAGALDLTFGNDGIVTTTIGTRAQASDLVILPDGRMVAVGHHFKSPPNNAGLDIGDFALARYLPTGALDTTFGGDGIVTTDIKKNDDVINAVVVQADGKIIAGGLTVVGTGDAVNAAFALTRYNVDGSLDTTFGGSKAGGKVVLDLSRQSDVITDLVLQADGKILAVGGSSYSDVALVRFLSNGTLDKSFGTNGVRVLDLGGFESAQNVVIQPDGKIVIAGLTDSSGSRNFLLARFSTSGVLDPTFGTAGIVTTNVVSSGVSLDDAAYTLARQADGKLVVAGLSGGRISLARYNGNGILDTTFGDDRDADGTRDGLVVTGIGADGTPSLVLDGSGRIIATTGSSITVARFLSDGSPDLTFGSSGVTGADIPDAGAVGIGAVALDANGQIVVTGYAGLSGSAANPTKGFFLIRFQGDDAPLQALGGPAPANASVAALTTVQVQPLLAEALARWRAAGADTSNLANISIRIADLPGGTLGLASGDTIWLDANGAGWGWFVDPTPGDDSEFTTAGNQGEMGRMDLLTALMHEMGHALGLDHQESGLMDDSLATGVRATAWAGAESDWSVLDSYFAALQVDSAGLNKRSR